MFERLFQKAMSVAARLLFAASLVMLLWGVAYSIFILGNFGMHGPSPANQAGWIGASLSILAISFAPAAQLFFGAVIVHYIEVWFKQRQNS